MSLTEPTSSPTWITSRNARACVVALLGVVVGVAACRTKPAKVRTTGAWHGAYHIASVKTGCGDLTETDAQTVFGGGYYAIRGALVAKSGVHTTPCATAEACREWADHTGKQTYTKMLSPGIDKDLLMEFDGEKLGRIAHYSSLNGGMSDLSVSRDTDGEVQIAGRTVPCRLRTEDMAIRRADSALLLEYTLSEGWHDDEDDCKPEDVTSVELQCVVRYVARLEALGAH